MWGFLNEKQQESLRLNVSARCSIAQDRMEHIVHEVKRAREKGKCYDYEFLPQGRLQATIPMATAARYINNWGVMQQFFAPLSNRVEVKMQKQRIPDSKAYYNCIVVKIW